MESYVATIRWYFVKRKMDPEHPVAEVAGESMSLPFSTGRLRIPAEVKEEGTPCEKCAVLP